VAEPHNCERCHVHQAEVVMKGPGGETTYLCTSPECMMAAGICTNCNVQLEQRVLDSGETVLECPVCGFQQRIVPLT